MKPYARQILIALCVYTGQISFGYVAAWPNYAMLKMTEDDRYQHMTPEHINWIVTSVFLGCVVGSLFTGYLSHLIGRKSCLILGQVLTGVCFLSMLYITSAPLLIFIRTIAGVGVCTPFLVNIIYLGEIASSEIRGTLLVGNGVFASLGSLILFSIGPYISIDVINYVGLGISVINVLSVSFIPDTPIYYILKGRYEEAKAVFMTLGREKDAEELSSNQIKLEMTQKTDWRQLLTCKSDRKALTITICLLFLQQMSGISPVIIYSTTIFKIASSSIPAHIATIGMGVANLVSGCVSSLLVDRFGRRFLMFLSTALSCFSLAILSVYLFLYSEGHPVTEKIKWLPLVAYVSFCCSFYIGFNVIPCTLVGEMFSLNVRSAGSAISITANFTFGFLVVTLYGYLVPYIGVHGLFGIFAAACAVSFIFTFFMVPETRGKSLIEVQKMLNK